MHKVVIIIIYHCDGDFFCIGQFEYYYAWINFWLHTHNRFSVTNSLTFCPLPIRYKNTEKNGFMSVMSLWWPMMINCRIDEFWGVFIYSDPDRTKFRYDFFFCFGSCFFPWLLILFYIWQHMFDLWHAPHYAFLWDFYFYCIFFLIFKFENEGEKINWMRRLLWIYFLFWNISLKLFEVWVKCWYIGF